MEFISHLEVRIDWRDFGNDSQSPPALFVILNEYINASFLVSHETTMSTYIRRCLSTFQAIKDNSTLGHNKQKLATEANGHEPRECKTALRISPPG